MRILVVAAAAVSLFNYSATTSVADHSPGDSIIVSTEWLAAHLSDQSVVVLNVDHESDAYRDGHIPGARFLDYMTVVASHDGLSTELPAANDLRERFEKLGVSNASHVVLYGPPLMVSRAFLALEYLGSNNVSVLNGGLTKWRAEKRQLTRDEPRVVAGKFEPHVRPEIIADADWVRARIGKPGVALVDTRTDGEYVGSGDRHGMPSSGHVQGAHQLQWQELFREPNDLLFRNRDELARLYATRAQPTDTVVTYCFVGYRASMTYLVARYLGYQAKLYDGSYEDWSRRQLPTVPGAAP
jgi:thiosulfate/3-mercaptopyruvate sulfurtransferase